MAQSSGRSTLFLQPILTEEINLGPPSTGGATPPSPEGLVMTPGDSFAHLSTFADSGFGWRSILSQDTKYVNRNEPTVNGYAAPVSVRPEDFFFDPIYQAAYAEMFCENNVRIPAEAMVVNGKIPQVTVQRHIPVATTSPTFATNLAPVLEEPPTVTKYPPGSDSHFHSPSSLRGSSVVLPPASSSAPSPSLNSSGSNFDDDYSSDDGDEYHPTQSAFSQGQKQSKSTSERENSLGSSRANGCSHSYQIQCKDSAFSVNQDTRFKCTVTGCEYVQKSQRISDLKRHIATHDRWREPGRWTCCGVGMDRAHLYFESIRQDMTDEERIEAGAYMFRGRLMIGGCMKTFSRRDALKRHVDTPRIPCVGHMDSY